MSNKFSYDQIYSFLKQVNQGANLLNLSKKHGFTVKSYERWELNYRRGYYSLMSACEALEAENTTLKNLIVDKDKKIQELDIIMKKFSTDGDANGLHCYQKVEYCPLARYFFR